ncbi:MAG: hypothetical protein PHR10_01750 [Sphaerochaetaceae bacterium]|nr:hypothetical protein [Sphaerochaetaceae bacterium]
MYLFILVLRAITWELPQNLLGFIIFAIFFATKRIKNISIEYCRCFIMSPIAISLGWFVFWHSNITIKRHEYGHSVQSRMLGPLYLILVGIPSLLRALYANYYVKTYQKNWPNYFNGYPENWADRLGKEN